MRAFCESGALRYYAWIAVATAVHHLVFTYWQLLPSSHHHPSKLASSAASATCGASSAKNGFVSAAASLLGGAAALVPMAGERCLQPRLYASVRAFFVCAAPLALAALLYGMAITHARLTYDVAFVLFHVLFELMRTVCDAEGARCVARTRYRGVPRFALVSGLSTTATLIIQTVGRLLAPRPLP